MKQQKQRILSALLALVMCLSLLPGTAQAESTTTVTTGNGTPSTSATGTYSTHGELAFITVFSAMPGPYVSVTKLPEVTLTLIVEYPDGYSYEKSYTASGNIVEYGGYGATEIPSYDTSLDITITQDGSADSAASNSGVIASASASGTRYDPVAELRDPTTVLDHDFSRWPFLGWYDVDTGKAVGMQVSLTRNMTLEARWGEDQKPAADNAAEVWFYSNGGTVTEPGAYDCWWDTIDGESMLHTLTDNSCRLSVLPQATRDGCTFDGWYTAPTGGVKVSANQDLSAYRGSGQSVSSTWSADQIVLWARWTADAAAQALRVDFDANGGAITSIRGIPAAQLAPGGDKAVETDTFVDTNSGAGMMMTGADHKLDSLPEAERSGYLLDGWYTLKEGGNKVTTDTVLSEGCTLYAHWTPAKNTCIVTYDWNGAAWLINEIEPQTVAFGGQPALYSINTDIGHTLKGWATEDGALWDSRTMTVTEDITLYAVWDPAFEDDFNFNNSDSYFSNYKVSDQYLKYLVRNEEIYLQNYIRDFSEKGAWIGSCFGMSAVYAMQKGGALRVSVFQSGAEGLRDLEAPNQSNNIRDLINYYMLSQLTTPASDYKGHYLKEENLSTRYSMILDDIQNSSGYTLLGFNYNGSGHAVIAKSVSNGRVTIWDPNCPGIEITLTISGGSAKFSGPSAFSKLISNYNTNTELKYVMPFETRSQNYDASNLQSVFLSGADAASSSTASSRATLTSTVGDFTVAAANGKTAAVKNGEPSGDLTMTRVYIDGAVGAVYRYELDTADAQSLTITLSSADAAIQLVTDSVYARVEAPKLKVVTVSDEAVTTTAASAGQQSITLVSEKLDDTWNKVTVTGSDTGFRVGAAAGKVTVASDNGVSATVTGENSKTWEEGKPQAVTASPDGTVLTTAQLSSGTASVQPAAFPFTDVEATRWFRPAVEAAYNAKLVVGLTDTTYGPSNTLTLAEAVTLAARIYAEAHNETAPSGGTPWYKAAYDYCVEKGVIDGSVFALTDMPRTATRFEMVAILDGAVPAERMDNSVTVGTIPDLAESAAYGEIVYRWYRAGILTGNDDGSFAGERSITRAEVAQILCTINRLL